MKSTCKELRNRAWETLRGNYWPLFLVYLILYVISGATGSVSFGVLTLLTLPMTYAADIAVLNLSRNRVKPQPECLFNVYRDNLGKAFLVPFLMLLFIYLWTLLFIIPGVIMAYAYSMAVFVANDNPELSAMDAIKKSRELMRGHKWDLFVLDLSFIGWILLSILTCGLGLLFLVPYIEAAHAEFYRELTEEAVDAQVVNE